jgi:hypothetical protein
VCEVRIKPNETSRCSTNGHPAQCASVDCFPNFCDGLTACSSVSYVHACLAVLQDNRLVRQARE